MEYELPFIDTIDTHAFHMAFEGSFKIKIQCYIAHYILHKFPEKKKLQLLSQVMVLFNKLLTETSLPFTQNLTSEQIKGEIL
jgi:hypothetical protein